MLADVSDDTPEQILGEDGGRAYRNYVDWTPGTGFALAIVEIALPRDRQALLAWTKRQLPETRVVDMAAADNKPMRPILDAAVAKPGTQVLALMRLDEPQNRKALFARMNIQRDELARDYPFPWVIMIHPVAALEMTMLAPDLTHFAGMWLREQVKADAPTGALRSLDTTPTSTVSHEGPKIEGSELLQQAQEMLTLRRLDEAADLLAQAELYDPAGRTTNGWRIDLGGWLLWLRGEPKQALAQLDKAREAFEQAGDERGRAVTLGRVADILQVRGDLDEALRIRREEDLPVYERLGDVRFRAVTLGKVADILQTRGDLDEALRIRREEQLPVYERLGDVRSLLVGRANLAMTLLDRNNPGDLSEAQRLLYLALAAR